ncbi:MAG: hypothetical protein QM765_29565 [Myxococcales bacterium]
MRLRSHTVLDFAATNDVVVSGSATYGTVSSFPVGFLGDLAWF